MGRVRRKGLSGWRVPLGLLMVSGALALAGCRGAEAQPQPQEQPAVTIGPEDVVRVEPQLLRSGPTLSGTLQARRAATLRAEVAGPVVEVVAEQGQRVKRGQLLARIQDGSLNEQLLAARTAARVASNSVELARADEARNQTLAHEGVVTRRDAERAQLARRQAEAQLSEAQARLSLARQQVDRTRIVAPFDGVVSERQVNAGDNVMPGAALFTLVDPSSLRLEAAVPASQLGMLRPDAAVGFSVSGYGDRVFMGRIERINPTVDPNTGQVRLYVTLPNQGQTLLTGLFAQGRVATQEREVLAAPASVVDTRSEPPTVVRVHEGRVERVPVMLGMRDELAQLVELRSGVGARELLLRGSARELADGMSVRLQPSSPPPARDNP